MPWKAQDLAQVRGTCDLGVGSASVMATECLRPFSYGPHLARVSRWQHYGESPLGGKESPGELFAL